MPDPGEKRKRYHGRRGFISDFRRFWMDLGHTYFIGYVTAPEDPDENGVPNSEVGHSVSVYIKQGYNTVGLQLTTMTQEELYATKQLLDIAFATARPTVIRRDKIAQEAFNAGDSSYTRLYRGLPKLFVREGAGSHDSEELLRGHDWVPGVDNYEVNVASLIPERVTGKRGSPVPERDKGTVKPQDNATEADKLTELRGSPGGTDLPSEIQDSSSGEASATPTE